MTLPVLDKTFLFTSITSPKAPLPKVLNTDNYDNENNSYFSSLFCYKRLLLWSCWLRLSADFLFLVITLFDDNKTGYLTEFLFFFALFATLPLVEVSTSTNFVFFLSSRLGFYMATCSVDYDCWDNFVTILTYGSTSSKSSFSLTFLEVSLVLLRGIF